jgi:predicted nucleotidyltransferase component of viral defense system
MAKEKAEAQDKATVKLRGRHRTSRRHSYALKDNMQKYILNHLFVASSQEFRARL